MTNNCILMIKEIWAKYPEISELSFCSIIDDLNTCYSFNFHLNGEMKIYWIEFNMREFDPTYLLEEIDKDFFQTEFFRDYCFDQKVKGERIREFIFSFYKSIAILDENELQLFMNNLIKMKKINLKNLIELNVL